MPQSLGFLVWSRRPHQRRHSRQSNIQSYSNPLLVAFISHKQPYLIALTATGFALEMLLTVMDATMFDSLLTAAARASWHQHDWLTSAN